MSREDGDPPNPVMSTVMKAARALAIDGAENIGPVMTVAILEFAAAELESRARDDGRWDEERYLRYCRDNERALERLAIERRRQQ